MTGVIPFNKLDWQLPYFEPYSFISGGTGGQESHDFRIPSGHIMRLLAAEITDSNPDDVGILGYISINSGVGEEPINVMLDRLKATQTAGMLYVPNSPVYAYYSVGMGVYAATVGARVIFRLQAQTAVFR